MAINPLGSINPTSALGNSRKSIAENFDTFLTLLTTQLKNQNPLDPLDTNQFTQQMVQFTGVEQQLKTNEFLKALTTSAQNASNTEAVSFIGKNVTASGASAHLSSGTATWAYSTSRSAPNSVITIRDANGAVVHTQNVSLVNGNGSYSWNGKDANGNQQADGNYSITMAGKDSNNRPVTVNTQITGTVSGVDLSGSEPVLIVGGANVKLSSVTSVRANS